MAADRKPQINEEDHLFKEIHHLITKIKAEKQLTLRKHQKVHNLHIAVYQNNSYVSPEIKRPN